MKNNVREAGARKGFTQVDLADAVNVTTACVYAVEHGRYDLMRHADIRTTMNVYGKAMDASKREAHGKVVRMVLAPKVA